MSVDKSADAGPAPREDAGAPPATPAPPAPVAGGLDRLRRRLATGAELWVFGYASLIWRPEFEFVERRAALVRGWHRALRMRSQINRGTPQCPGLVYALVPGGACRGVVFRIAADRADEELDRLWAREMPLGDHGYDPRWLRAATAHGDVTALAFTLRRASPEHTGAIADDAMVEILRRAQGRYGTTLDYLCRTASALDEHGMCDRESRRLVALARRRGLI